MIHNVLIGTGILLVLLFVVWVLWTYHKSGKLRDVSGIVSAIAMVACLPLAGKLVQERTSFLSRASVDPIVIQTEYHRISNDQVVVYVTLSESAFAYIEVPEDVNPVKVITSQGKLEQRIGHSFIIKTKNSERFEADVYVNGKLDTKKLVVM